MDRDLSSCAHDSSSSDTKSGSDGGNRGGPGAVAEISGSGSWTFTTFVLEKTGRTRDQVRGSLLQEISIYDVLTEVDVK